jgi:hypothetical protein
LSVRIDLSAYLGEFEAFSALADNFVDKSSTLRLAEVVGDLKTGVTRGLAKWIWETRADIVFRPSTIYDGPGRNHAETWLDVRFKCKFVRPQTVKRAVSVWEISNAATHLRIRKQDGDLPFHFDYKNRRQWGPQMHFQVSEALGNLPIPRILSPIFLPSDCADLALAELHPEEWRRLQAAGNSSRHVSVIRDAQEHRTLTYLRDIGTLWASSNASTRVCMLQDYTATPVTLPDWRGRTAASW